MGDNEKYDIISKTYRIAYTLYEREKDINKKREYAKVLVDCSELLRQMRNNINSAKKNNQQIANKTYHYVSVYNPFASIAQINNITCEYGDNFDSVMNVLTVRGTRKENGFFGVYNKPYTYKKNFPIIVEKNGIFVHDVITKEEYIPINESNNYSNQVRYKDRYFYVNEKYLGNKIVVFVKQSIPEMIVADMLRTLSNEDVITYKKQMIELRNKIISINRDYFEEKRIYESTHISDSEYIRRFGKK